MKLRWVFLFFSLLFEATAFPLTHTEEAPTLVRESLRPTTSGFYPLWENTAYVEKHGQTFMGLHSLHTGVLDRIQIGVQPVMFIYRTPNVHIKGSLYESEAVTISSQVGLFYLLEGASRSSMSPTYTSRLDNPDFAITLLPLSVVATYHLFSWLDIHQTFTGLSVFSNGSINNELFLGHNLETELFPRGRHALSLHWSEVGFWKKDLRVLGVSYRYRNTWFEGRTGYFYRLLREGIQSGPLITFGFLL